MTTTERPAVLKARSKALAKHLEMLAQDLEESGFTETAKDCDAASACITQLLDLIERTRDSANLEA